MTIRVYSPRSDSWNVTYASALDGTTFSFAARRQGDEIVLDGKEPGGRPMRWIISEVTPRSFRWRAVVLDPDERTWALHQEMTAKRR